MWLAFAVAVALPLTLVWMAALLARNAAEIRGEAERLSRAADALRDAAAQTMRSDAAPARHPAVRTEPPVPVPPDAPATALQRTPQAPATPKTRVAPPPAPPATAPNPVANPPRQDDLPLAMEAQGVEVPLPALIRALDFPESAADEEGFRALRVALADPRARRLVQASQDMLTLLSEDGIYMDDLAPEPARPDLWRRFAGGERGPELGTVGGVHDRSSLALSAARMRADPVFRDAGHHFLRLFDQALAQVAPGASDAELAALADTRTARAFMLVGRVAGIFE